MLTYSLSSSKCSKPTFHVILWLDYLTKQLSWFLGYQGRVSYPAYLIGCHLSLMIWPLESTWVFQSLSASSVSCLFHSMFLWTLVSLVDYKGPSWLVHTLLRLGNWLFLYHWLPTTFPTLPFCIILFCCYQAIDWGPSKGLGLLLTLSR